MFYFIAYTLIFLFFVVGVSVAARIMDEGDQAARAERDARMQANAEAKAKAEKWWMANNGWI